MKLTSQIKDEVFVSRDLNLVVRIYEIIKKINSNNLNYKLINIETKLLKNLLRSDQINTDYLLKLSKHRIDEPIIICCFKNIEILCDGNHRLFKRLEFSMKETLCVYIDEKTTSEVSEDFM